MAFSSGTVTIGANTKKSDYNRLLDNTQNNRSRVSSLESGTVAITYSEIQTFNSSTIFNATATLFDSVRRVTSANYIHGPNISYNTIFDKISPFIPNVGDIMIITGGISSTVAARVERTGASEITLYGMASSNEVAIVIADGGATTLDTSLAW